MVRAKKRVRVRLDADLRRQQILEVATRIISRRGYNGFGIQELAEECGLTNAGLLYYFGTKEGLLIALLEDRDRRDTVAVTSVLHGPRDIHKRLTLEEVVALLRETVKRNSEEPELVRLFTVLRAEALSQDHPARAYFINREKRVVDAFALMVTPHVKHPRSTARQLTALISGLEEQWLRSGHGFDLLAEWDRGVALLLPVSRPRS
jgi:AcrR family transcriptional regulator